MNNNNNIDWKLENNNKTFPMQFQNYNATQWNGPKLFGYINNINNIIIIMFQIIYIGNSIGIIGKHTTYIICFYHIIP